MAKAEEMDNTTTEELEQATELVDKTTSSIKKKHQDYMKTLITKNQERLKTEISSNPTLRNFLNRLEEEPEVLREYQRTFENFPDQTEELQGTTEELIRIISEHLENIGE